MKNWKDSGIGILMLSLLAMSTFALTPTIEPANVYGSDYTYNGAIYINANGTITPSEAPISNAGNVTYTFTDNITAFGIVVLRSNIVLDGDGHTLQAKTPLTYQGVDVYAENVTVQNIHIANFVYGIRIVSYSNGTISGNNVTGNYYGIYYDDSDNNTITGNTITNSHYGIFTQYFSNNTFSYNNVTGSSSVGIYVNSSYNNTISRNNVTNNGYGIMVYYSDYNSVSYNNINGSSGYGMYIGYSYNSTISANTIMNNGYGLFFYYCSNSTLTSNVMGNNGYNFALEGESLSDFLNYVDTSNKVNSKPIYYWINYHDTTVPSDAGCALLVNCTNMQVKNLKLEHAQAVLFAYTTNSTITQNNMTNNYYGGYLVHSSNNTITGNTITDNSRGIYTYESYNNTISYNNVTSNSYGIDIYSSYNNTISYNNVTSNSYGIDIYSSYNNAISYNNIAGNDEGIYFEYSNNNTITENTITDNYEGIEIYSSSNNTISYNNIIGNGYDGICFEYSNNNTITENTITDNSYGIDIYDSYNNTISYNTITYNAMGIYTYESYNNAISYNNIAGNDEGIYFEYSNNNTITENTITGNSYEGIEIYSSSNNTISYNNIIGNGYYGIYYDDSDNNTITGNTIMVHDHGIYTFYFSNNTISANTIMNNDYGLYLAYSSDNNTIIENNIGSNIADGMYIFESSGNIIYHNNFVDNFEQVYTDESPNIWDDGYPSGGNYWSDYQARYPDAAEIDWSDIWDTPYVIDSSNTDNYPLMQPWPSVVVVSYLVVRGEDDGIYYRLYNSNSMSWESWNSVPYGSTPDSPAAVVCSNTLYIAVRGFANNNQSIYFGSINLTDNNFSGWTLLSGSTPSAPTLTSNGTTLTLVVRGEENLIYYRFYDIASQTWTDWGYVPLGATCDSPAAAVLANQLHIVVRGMDGYSIWHCSLNLSTSVFSGWELVGGATPSRPTLTTCGALNELCLAVKGTDHAIYYNTWNDSGWSGWVCLRTGFPPSSPGATVVGEQLQVAVRHTEAGEDLDTLWFGTVDLKTGVFSGWAWLSGATPSAPTSTS